MRFALDIFRFILNNPDMQKVRNSLWEKAGLAGIVMVILGPLWGYVAMGLCRLLKGGMVADTLSFYLMVAGWLIMPVGILLLLYRLAVRTIITQRRDHTE